MAGKDAAHDAVHGTAIVTRVASSRVREGQIAKTMAAAPHERRVHPRTVSWTPGAEPSKGVIQDGGAIGSMGSAAGIPIKAAPP